MAICLELVHIGLSTRDDPDHDPCLACKRANVLAFGAEVLVIEQRGGGEDDALLRVRRLFGAARAQYDNGDNPQPAADLGQAPPARNAPILWMAHLARHVGRFLSLCISTKFSTYVKWKPQLPDKFF